MSAPRGILVVQTAFLGDVVLTTPLVGELRRSARDARIAVVTTPLGAAALGRGSHGETVIAYDKNGRDRGPLGLLRLLRRLRSERFEAAVAAHRSWRTGLIVRGSGAPRRIGFAGAPGRWAYTEQVAWDPGRHAVFRYLALSEPLGGQPDQAEPRPVLHVAAEASRTVEVLLQAEGIDPGARLAVVAPGSIWATKRWTPRGYAEVVSRLPALGLAVALVGSPDERALCEEIAREARTRAPVLAGRTGLPELTALVARASVVVTNDSGPGHVASAVGTPVVAIFGPTVPAFGYTPFGEHNVVVERSGLDCRPCDRHGPRVCPLGHHRCMSEIAPDTVVAAVASALERPRAAR